MELKDLFDQKIINFKMYTVSVSNNIVTQKQLLDYYNTNGNFLQFKNCGNKTNLELVNFCEKSRENDFNINDILSNISDEQKLKVNNYIIERFKKLNNRSQNGLNKLLSKSINLDSLVRKGILEPQYEYLKIPFLGLKSSEEVKLYFLDIRNFIFTYVQNEKFNPIIK